MKNLSERGLFVTAAVGLLAAMCLSPAIAHSQSGGMSITVPFEFYIGALKLPAGQYAVSQPGNNPSVIQISDRNGHSAVMLTNAASNQSGTQKGQLVFNRYGDYSFL